MVSASELRAQVLGCCRSLAWQRVLTRAVFEPQCKTPVLLEVLKVFRARRDPTSPTMKSMPLAKKIIKEMA